MVFVYDPGFIDVLGGNALSGQKDAQQEEGDDYAAHGAGKRYLEQTGSYPTDILHQ